MRSVLRHVALESSINVVRVVAGDAARLLLVADILPRHQRLRTFNCFVLRTVLRRILRALLVIIVAAVHAANSVPDRAPKQVPAQVAVRRRRVRVLLEAMRMGEAFLIARQLSTSDDVHRCAANGKINFKMKKRRNLPPTCCACNVHAIGPTRC